MSKSFPTELYEQRMKVDREIIMVSYGEDIVLLESAQQAKTNKEHASRAHRHTDKKKLRVGTEQK
ncbi:hypothetical protein [Xenorhabdus nematophila]|uniref:hypothetical protein n=1 Tax=Xenorhabdus nematophila TaxID=628 RepID=UPI001F2CE6AA|nr:hypothetical protein [Xenorhabdus nematophila]